jgi:hypothetical protein
MQLTSEQMDNILDSNLHIIMQDPNVIALEFEVEEDGNVTALLVIHREPETAREFLPNLTTPGAALLDLPVKVIQGDEIVDELGRVADGPPMEGASLLATAGMSGTTVREGGFYGTLCLSGSQIAIDMGGRTCTLNAPFLLSNSHVFHAVGRKILSFGNNHLGTVTCLYDLEARTTFDAGIARGTDQLDPQNAFVVFNPDGPERKIEGLRTVERNWAISKQGARTGWTSGRTVSPARITVRGHRAVYPCWKGTYSSLGGDSGSPILHEIDGKWFLVGIHFASGPYFHSWNNAAVTAAP